MSLPLYIYVVLSVVASIAALFDGIGAGLCALLTSTIALIAGGGSRAMLVWGGMSQKAAGTVVALLLAALAYWLSGGFSVGLFSYRFTGAQWGAFGFAIAFLWVHAGLSRRLLRSKNPCCGIPQ